MMNISYPSHVSATTAAALSAGVNGTGGATLLLTRATVGMTRISGTNASGHGTILWCSDTSQPSTVIWECIAPLGAQPIYSEIIAR
jgi:hypothetical protein